MTLADSAKAPATVVGIARPNVEAARHVRGRGQFIGDLQLPGMLHMALLRSPHAHARILGYDMTRALDVTGVHAVLTGADVAERSQPVFTLAEMHNPALHIHMSGLAHEKVRHAGEGVAAVAATTRAIAEDACEAIKVEYEQLPPLIDPSAAITDGAPLIHEELGTNIIMERSLEWGSVGEAFDAAVHIERKRLSWARHSGTPLDTFGLVAQFDPGTGELTYWTNLQSHSLVWTLGKTLRMSPSKIRAIPRDVGGAFGGKFWVPRNLVVAALLSMETERPVKFIEDRVENLVAGDNHGEDRVYDAELALDAEGRMLALRFSSVEDYGAYFLLGPANNASPLAQATGPYRIPALGVDFTAVLTNKTNQGAYRGIGAAPMNFLLERLTDGAARSMGLTPVEIRERNLIQSDEFPYRTPVGNHYDSGDYPEALRRALEFSGYHRWRATQLEARAEGRYIGVGLATTQERSVPSLTELWLMFEKPTLRPTTAAETVTCRLDGEGHLRIALHSPSLGTAPETVATMVAAEELGVDPNHIVVSRLDTAVAGPAMGPAGSRLTVMTAGAIDGAVGEIKAKMCRIAAHLLEASPDDVVYDPRAGGAMVRGAPNSLKTLHELARIGNSGSLSLPPGERSGLDSTFTYDHPQASMPEPDDSSWGNFNPIVGHSVHVPVVEVDVLTGMVKFLDYAVLHDCGTIVNPPALDGQIIGGICQGIGSALYEEFLYDDQGRMTNGNFPEYLVPTFVDMPRIRIEHMATPSPYTYRGVKGAGEGGRMAAPAAVVSAVEDALTPFAVEINEVPVTPEKIVRWIQNSWG